MTMRRSARPAGLSRQRHGGFTLLEMLAAFVIFAIGFSVMMELASSSLRNARNGAELTEAALWAQSKLDVAGLDKALAPGSEVGEFDRKYRWEMNITEWEPPADAAPIPVGGVAPLDIFKIELIVRWGQGERERRARFVTLRALQPGQEQG
jgi:general secretion pathway protein I